MSFIPEIDKLRHVTREQVEQDLESVLALIDSGYSPVVITVDGKPDLLLFSWEDYKRRFSLCYLPEHFEEIEAACRAFKEET